MLARKLPSLVVLLAVSGCSAPPTAPSSNATVNGALGVQNPERPIQGTCEVTFAPPVPVGPFQIRVVIDGTCQVSHLGRTGLHIDQIVTFNQDGSADAVATLVHTAANGDELRACGTSHFLPATPQGILLFTAANTFTGGTGRFIGATGASSIPDGFANLGTLVGGYTFTGTISY
jgi:hypothetical protein